MPCCVVEGASRVRSARYPNAASTSSPGRECSWSEPSASPPVSTSSLARPADQRAGALHTSPSPPAAVLAQEAGADEGQERHRREHRPHAVPEVPRTLVGGPRAGQLVGRCVGGDAGQFLIHGYVREDRK